MKKKSSSTLGHRDDILNALVCDLLADQVYRALALGFTHKEVAESVVAGHAHGRYEYDRDQKFGPKVEP